MNTPVLAPPALDIDMTIARIRDNTATSAPLNSRQVLERRIVWNFLHHMFSHGWWVTTTWDGQERESMPEPSPGSDNSELHKAVMEIVFNLDEVSLYLTNGNSEHHVYFVLGEGDTILTDWSYSVNDEDGFNKAVDAFSSDENMQRLF